MDGIGGKPAWAWIFILEGLLTVVAGAMSFWIIQDFPDTAKFLNEAERTFVIRRLQEDDQHSAGGENLKWTYIFQSLLDWKTWLGSKCYLRLSWTRVGTHTIAYVQCFCTWAQTALCMLSRFSCQVSSTR